MPAATPVACPQCSAPHDGREMLYTAPLKRRCAACQHVFEDPESRRDFDARMRGTRTPTLEVSPEEEQRLFHGCETAQHRVYRLGAALHLCRTCDTARVAR